ncbi:DNA/RNA nuclease SfsA [Temperatibacter marinus]|uniref:Sugar fermentation stimulation protein homolog n=1 Tax=Temperatibacter marinus TaxID=1456591 RepID=A0AA52H9H9_9PROT|nr:DNA/RNA nuclease SfsA [Temperatibacter marinus]WND02527.1 DNA/RNA nuclease SfsA [Temperatibacter marinus]
MQFTAPLRSGKLVKRYKRFLADIELECGEIITAHCANSGSMLGLKEEGSLVWVSPNTNPKAKLDWRWELVDREGSLVGINTARPNAIVEEAILQNKIAELAGYDSLKREVKYGENSRIDILLSNEKSASHCYVEVKSVTLKAETEAEAEERRVALFPDSVTSRGKKHLLELEAMVKEGHRSVMVFLVQREDVDYFSTADTIDPAYGQTLREVLDAGVEALCYQCAVTTKEIKVVRKLPIKL